MCPAGHDRRISGVAGVLEEFDGWNPGGDQLARVKRQESVFTSGLDLVGTIATLGVGILVAESRMAA